MISAHQILNDSRDLTTPLSEIVWFGIYGLAPSTWYDQPVYQILSS